MVADTFSAMDGIAFTEIAFIDTTVADYRTLMAGMRPGMEVILIDGAADGLAQIAAALQGRSGIDAVHLFTHGAPGMLQLGSSLVTQASLAGHAADMATVRAALADGADLLLYGCDVALGEKGSAFIAALAAATGADVAASVDPTGSALLGGNWTLEAQTGKIEAAPAPVPLASYSGLLAIGDLNFDGLGTIDYAYTDTASVGGWRFTSAVPTYMAVVDTASNFPSLLLYDEPGNTNDSAMLLNYLGDPGVLSYAMGSQDGTNFKLESFKIGQSVGANTMLTVSAYRNGALVVPAETVNLASSDSTGNIFYTLQGSTVDGRYGTLAFNSTALFNDIDEIRFSFADTADLQIDNIDVSAAIPDTTPPAFASAAVNGTQLVMTYSETTLLATAAPAPGAFTVLAGGVAVTVSNVAIDQAAKTVTLTLASAVQGGQAVTVAYTDPTAGDDINAIQDVTGNDAATLPATAVTNNTPDTTAPVFASATVNGSQLVMTYTEITTLDAGHPPLTGSFAVRADGSLVTVNSVSVDANAKTVTLTLASAVGHGQAVTVAYTDPTAGNDVDAIQDAAGNDAATLAATAVTNNTADSSAPVVGSLALPANGSYRAGQALDFTVTFDENVTVTGTASTLGLQIGSASRTAAYLSKTADSITYRYTVQAGDNDADGIELGTLALNGSTIRDAAGNNADLSLTGVGSTAGILVDTAAPAVATVAVPPPAYYSTGNVLSFTVTFDENVTVTGTDSRLGLTIGSTARNADYASKTGNSITYTYTVQAGDLDTDGIAVGAIALNTTTVRDAAGNAASVVLTGHVPSTAGVAVDAVAPGIAGTIDGPASGRYGVGDTLTFTVTFDELVAVTGSGSTLALTIGATIRQAAFVSATPDSIIYAYTVAAGDSDADGIAVGAIALNGTTIRDVAGNSANLSLAGHLPALTGVLVDTTAPAVTGNIAVPANGSYGVGSTLTFTVTFDENVTIDGTDSTLALIVGSTTRHATLATNTGNSLTYTYTVQAGDTDANGIAVGSIDLGTTTIRDAAGNDATVSLAGHLPSTAGILVDTTAPGVAAVAVPANNVYSVGAALDFTVTFDENVTIGGTDSTLALTVGTAARTATFLSASGNTVTWRYTVQAGDVDADGIAVGAIGLGTSTIRDGAGNHAAIALTGHVPDTSGVLVDATVPAVASVQVPANGTYAAGQTLEFTVLFDENVTVTGSDSRLALTIGSTPQYAAFVSGAGNAVTFAYTVQAGDADANGIAIDALDLGASTIRDAAGNAAALSLAGHVPATTGVLVDTAPPVFASATVNGGSLVLAYSDTSPLDAAHAPAGGAFTVLVDGTAVAVTAVTVNGAAHTVTLTLATPVTNGQAVTVAYTDPTFGNDANAIQDAAGNDAASLPATPVANNTPPVVVTPPPAGTTVDGVVVTVGTVINSDGSLSQVMTIPVVTPARIEQVGNNDVADIPLVRDSAGASLLTAQVPVGYGMQVSGAAGPKGAGDALADLIREIRAHTAAGSADQGQLTDGGSGFLGGLDAATPLLVQTIVPTAVAGGGQGSLVLTGTPTVAGNPYTALVIDARALAPDATIELHNVEFAAVIGAVRVVGGTGAQNVWGDSAAQTIVLGEGDDILHGGAGNDTVGSAGGNDRIFGDAGDDLVFGGAGNDTIDGGTGIDTVLLAGANRSDYSFRVVDGQLVMTHLHGGSDGSDVVGNVELLRFTNATADTSVYGTVTRLVEALTDRAADLATLDAMTAAAQHGATLAQIAQALYDGAAASSGAAALDDAAFIGLLYQNVFGRVADGGGLAYWRGLLDAGASRADVALGIANSPEKLAMPQADTDFNTGDVATLVRLYSSLFERAPDAGGLNYWIAAHEGGMSIAAIADAFVASVESSGQYAGLGDGQFVDALYRSALHRTAQAEETGYWVGELAAGHLDRGDVLLGFANSAEKIALIGTISTSIDTL